MNNAETTAGASGGPAATATGQQRLGELPDRVRVHALAKLLATTSREVLAKLAELGESARSVQSSVPRAVAYQVAESLEQPPGQAAAGESAGGAEGAEKNATPHPADDGGTVAEETGPTGSTERAKPQVGSGVRAPMFAAPSPVFLPAEADDSASTTGTSKTSTKDDEGTRDGDADSGSIGSAHSTGTADAAGEGDGDNGEDDGEDDGRRRRRRGRRGRGRGKGGDDAAEQGDEQPGKERAEGGDASAAGQAGKAADKNARAKKPDDKKAADKTAADKTAADKGSAKAERSGGKQEKAAGSDKPGDKSGDKAGDKTEDADDADGSKRRRRRRRKGNSDSGAGGESGQNGGDDPPNTVVHVRDSSGETGNDGVRSVRGSTRLEAKRQRRRDGREAGRRRVPVLSEAEFLARRESVTRAMVVAEKGDSTQIGVLEDGVLVEHFVTSSSDSGSIVGNVYLGRVQNVLPSMEAAFIDIGRGRNAVLYAGEVDWDAAGLEGKARKIEQALSTGDSVLVQVTKDPVGHKGARLTTQISLPGRFLVYVPAGGATGISRKLPEGERRRLKDILKRIVPEDAGVIIRTASEGVSEQELERDVQRLKAQWDTIKEQANSAPGGKGQSKKSGAPVALYEEPDLLIKVVRDLFTEDFESLEVQGDRAWETIKAYVDHVAPDLADRVKRQVGNGDLLATHRVDEQITKALDRKVWLPSGGYLVIDRTEAMTVIDVNTGKFTGSGGNLEETVTRNNLESAEEIVRQLRLRDIGGIIVIDFIDMVLESNRELVLRRLTECLGRDRTRHQVAEVTSLGLVQMTRKRIGTGLLEAFSTSCEHCKGRGLIVSGEPQRGGNTGQSSGGSRRSRGGRGKSAEDSGSGDPVQAGPTPEQRESVATAVAAMANASKVAAKVGDSHQHKGGDQQDQQDQQEQASRNGMSDPEVAENGPEVAQPEAAQQAVRTTAPTTQSGQSAQLAQPAQSAQPAEESVTSEVPEVPAPRPTGRRGRRAASRPAGPPVQAPE